MICSPLDTQLIRLAKKHGIVYTRYVDDITLSTFNDRFPEAIVKGDVNNLIIGSELGNILRKNSFDVNLDKVFLNNNFTRQEVTGLIVNKFPNVKREYIKNLRAILHKCYKKGIYETALEYIDNGYCKNKDIIRDLNNKELINNWFKCVLKGKPNFIKEIRGYNDYIFLKYAQQLNRVFNEEIFNVCIMGLNPSASSRNL